MIEGEAWAIMQTKAAKDSPKMDTVESWKKLIDELPPPLISIDVNYGVLLKHTIELDLVLFTAHVPFGNVKANKSPWWWPRKLARGNYHEAPSKWLWLGKRKPWWFRMWFNG